MLYTEVSDDVLEKYTKQRCDNIRSMYDILKRDIMKLSTTNDDLEKFELVSTISKLIESISYEHIDTLDRYLYAYEGQKRLSNVVTRLRNGEES